MGCSEDTTDTTEQPAQDTTPPEVLASFPADGATDVTRSGPFWVLFSEEMDTETVESNVSFIPGIYHNLSWKNDTLFVNLTSLLENDYLYSMVIGENCEDTSGNELGADHTVSFNTTGEEDVTAPYVIGTDPSNGENDVSPSNPITITFSEMMAGMFDWSQQNDIEIDPVPDEFETWMEWLGLDLVIYHPPFPTDSLITVTVSGAATDLSGNPMGDVCQFSFRTLDDNVRPYLAGTSPPNGATGVPRNISQIVMTFSEPMYPYFGMPASNVDARIIGLLSSEPAWNDDYSSITLTPAMNLFPGCTYWVILGAGVTDQAGNPIDPDPTEYSFTTSGAPQYFLVESSIIWYSSITSAYEETRRIENYNPGTGTFDIVFEEVSEIREIWHMQWTSTCILHLGRDEYDGGIYEFTMTWNDPMSFLKLPVTDWADSTWESSTTFEGGSGTETIDCEFHIGGEAVDLENDELEGTFKGCYIHSMSVTLNKGTGGEHAIHYTSWLAPGIGWIKTAIEDDYNPPDTLVVYRWEL